MKKNNTNLKYSEWFFVIIIFLSISVLSLYGHNGFSDKYKILYSLLGIGCIVLAAIIVSLAFIKNKVFDETDPRSPLGVGFIAESNKLRPLSNLPLAVRIGFILFWTLIIIFIAGVGFQLIPVPQAIDPLSQADVGALTNIYFSSVPVGVFEDFIFLMFIPSIIITVLLGIDMFIVRRRLSIPRYLLYVFIGCFIGTVGYGTAIVPGFVNTHQSAYENNIQAYGAAFLFGMPTAVLYQVTGLFLPTAHIAHNAVYLIQQNVGFSIGGTATE